MIDFKLSSVQDFFEARKLLLYVKTLIDEGFAATHDVLGSGAMDDQITNQQMISIYLANIKVRNGGWEFKAW